LLVIRPESSLENIESLQIPVKPTDLSERETNKMWKCFRSSESHENNAHKNNVSRHLNCDFRQMIVLREELLLAETCTDM
jgi:hypothetical protein